MVKVVVPTSRQKSSLDKLEGLLSPRADVVKPPRGDPALSPWTVESEKGLRASQVGTDYNGKFPKTDEDTSETETDGDTSVNRRNEFFGIPSVLVQIIKRCGFVVYPTNGRPVCTKTLKVTSL